MISNVVSITQTGTCEVVQYALAKATGLRAININNATSATAFEQYVNAPQPITVYGVDFYAYKSNENDPSVDIELDL